MSHDVFISYASLDNVPCCGDKKNPWVKRLHEALFADLSTRLGRKANIFYDKKSIKDGDEFKETIKEALKDSATMLVVLSPPWAKSEPCKSEYQFYQRIKEQAESNTFIIERLDIDSEDWNMLKKLFRKLDEIQRRKFYRVDENGVTKTYGVHADEVDFYNETDELSWMIKSKLAKREPPPGAEGKRVFIYCATEGLSEKTKSYLLQLHRELRDYLEKKVIVGHLSNDWLTDEPGNEDDEARELALTEEIRKCDRFVQLVTKDTHGQVNASTQALEIAKTLGKPLSIWSAAITNNEEITFSGPFENFKDEVLSSLQAGDAEDEGLDAGAEIESYAYFDRGDDFSAENLNEIASQLHGRGVELTPVVAADDIEILEQVLNDPACNAVITIRREIQPDCLNARINTELDQQIAVYRKETGIQRLILNSSGLDNNQVSSEIANGDWEIVSQVDQLMGRLQINSIRYSKFPTD